MSLQTRTGLILAAVYVVLAASLMAREEWITAQQYRQIGMSPDWFERETESQPKQVQSTKPTVSWDCRTVCYFPSYREKLVYLLNFPTAPLLGWYGHPINPCIPPFVMTLGQKVKLDVHGWYRVVLFDVVLLLAIGLHWFVLGNVLVRLHVPRSVLKFFTGFAILLTCLALP